MKKQPSAYMRKHARGKILTNPPRAKRRKRRVASSKAVAARTPVIRATGIGHVVEIVYRREGRKYRHTFRSGTVLACTSDDQLIIAGKSLRVRRFIED